MMKCNRLSLFTDIIRSFENLLVTFLVSQLLDHKYLFIWTESVQIVQEEGVQKLGHLHHHGWSGGGHHYARVHRVPVMLLVTCYSLLTPTTMADIHEVRSRQNQDEEYLNITSLLQ